MIIDTILMFMTFDHDTIIIMVQDSKVYQIRWLTVPWLLFLLDASSYLYSLWGGIAAELV